MKKKYFIVIIFLLCSCTYKIINEIEDYDYIPDNSIRFIRTEDETSILINKDNIYYLLLLNKQNVNIDVDYLIKYKNIDTDIECDEEYILNNDISIDNIEFRLNNKIEINLNKQSICIYIKELDKDDYSDCTFIYLYNPDNNFYITLNSELLGLFYHSYTKFNYKFLHHMSTVWIDSFTIVPSSYTTLTIKDNDFEITSNKIRNKTIHKK